MPNVVSVEGVPVNNKGDSTYFFGLWHLIRQLLPTLCKLGTSSKQGRLGGGQKHGLPSQVMG